MPLWVLALFAVLLIAVAIVDTDADNREATVRGALLFLLLLFVAVVVLVCLAREGLSSDFPPFFSVVESVGATGTVDF